jgi:hypothetical protein
MQKEVMKMENPIRKVADRYDIAQDEDLKWLFMHASPITIGIKGKYRIEEDKTTITIRKGRSFIILFKDVTNIIVKM